MLRHFETLAKARKYVASKGTYEASRLHIVRRKRKSKKPYIVGTNIALLHRPDSAY